jgi:hypothetical protein
MELVSYSATDDDYLTLPGLEQVTQSVCAGSLNFDVFRICKKVLATVEF